MAKSAAKPGAKSQPNSEPWKGKSPTAGNLRGQWKQPRSGEDESGVGFVHLSAKVRPEEKEAFKQACQELGVTPNKAVRIFVRQCCGFLEVSDAVLTHLATVTRQISGVSTNINQIAKAGNQTKNPDYLAFMEDRKELGSRLAELEDIIREIVNVGKRRSDGLRKLTALIAEDGGELT